MGGVRVYLPPLTTLDEILTHIANGHSIRPTKYWVVAICDLRHKKVWSE